MENKNTILTIILAIGLVLVSLFLVYQTKIAETKTIDVIGSYSTNVDPDQAEITFNLVTTSSTLLEAQQMNLRLANDLVTQLKNSGLTEKEIQTISYYSNKKTVWENNKYVEKGYEVVNSMQIKTKNLDKIGDYIDLASKNGVENINNLQFTLSEAKKEEIYQDAIAQAGKNARDRADRLGETVGFRVKGVKSISLNNLIQPPIYFANALGAKEMSAQADSTPIQPQQVNIDVTVDVIFNIN